MSHEILANDDGYLTDFISGKQVKSGPEEVEAVQIFSRMLVEDYGYPKERIQTRPQWRVKSRPSDRKKEYPVDIAVFDSDVHEDGSAWIVVECKKKHRRDGRGQLEDYLRFCRAQIGVWFNGNERLFLRKVEGGGKVEFVEIPNIPRFGERIEDIGLYKRCDLKPAGNLRSVFQTIRNYLAANAVGITRDEIFAAQLINIIFCKIYDERFTKPDDTVRFRAGLDESDAEIKKRICEIFDKVQDQYSDVISKQDQIILDERSVAYVVGELHLFSLTAARRDAVADAFETFIGPSLKGGQGQFFTPRSIVELLIGMVDPSHGESMIDPACGTGGFLLEGLKHIWAAIEVQGEALGWPEAEIHAEQQRAAIANIRGIDKDDFLSKVAKAYMAVMGDGRGGIFCENSLVVPDQWATRAKTSIPFGHFDCVLTNPPFGKKLRVDDKEILKQYALAKKWKRQGKGKDRGDFEQSSESQDSQTPQILFIERCLELLKPGGRLGIIVPESMICNPSHRYIMQFLKSQARIVAVVSLPEELFQPYTHAKTSAVFIEKTPTDNKDRYKIFMAVAKWCGHDSRGLLIPNNDIPDIADRFKRWRAGEGLDYDHLGFSICSSQIVDDIYLPKYYNPEITGRLSGLEETHELVMLGDLEAAGIIKIASGHEVGKLAYGTGSIPFVRTSEIANWEIKIDPKHGVSTEIYESLKARQDVKAGDILMVRDGTYLVGSCALVTELDERIVYQSHIWKIRSTDHDRLHPYLLLVLLSSPIVKEQIFAKRFTQDIIDTLGSRVRELMLPIPRLKKKREESISAVEEVISARLSARETARRVIVSVAPTGDDDLDEYSAMTMSNR